MSDDKQRWISIQTPTDPIGRTYDLVGFQQRLNTLFEFIADNPDRIHFYVEMEIHGWGFDANDDQPQALPGGPIYTEEGRNKTVQ